MGLPSARLIKRFLEALVKAFASSFFKLISRRFKMLETSKTIPQPTVVPLAGSLTGSVDGTIADIAATAAATAGGSSPTAAQVDTGIATAVASIVTGTNLQLKELQTKLNELINDLASNGYIKNA
jgi:hypothetical protein